MLSLYLGLNTNDTVRSMLAISTQEDPVKKYKIKAEIKCRVYKKKPEKIVKTVLNYLKTRKDVKTVKIVSLSKKK